MDFLWQQWLPHQVHAHVSSCIIVSVDDSVLSCVCVHEYMHVCVYIIIIIFCVCVCAHTCSVY